MTSGLTDHLFEAMGSLGSEACAGVGRKNGTLDTGVIADRRGPHYLSSLAARAA